MNEWFEAFDHVIDVLEPVGELLVNCKLLFNAIETIKIGDFEIHWGEDDESY